MVAVHGSLVNVAVLSITVLCRKFPPPYGASGAFSPWIQGEWLLTGVERTLSGSAFAAMLRMAAVGRAISAAVWLEWVVLRPSTIKPLAFRLEGR
jgi:hypothetical protein